MRRPCTVNTQSLISTTLNSELYWYHFWFSVFLYLCWPLLWPDSSFYYFSLSQQSDIIERESSEHSCAMRINLFQSKHMQYYMHLYIHTYTFLNRNIFNVSKFTFYTYDYCLGSLFTVHCSLCWNGFMRNCFVLFCMRMIEGEPMI